jgi:hypothetical protein
MRARIVPISCLFISLLFLIPCAAVAKEERPLFASELRGATLSETGYIGVWADSQRSDCDVFPPPFTTFDVWIWCLPSVRGLQAAEFAISFPSGVFAVSEVLNPDIVIWLGYLNSGTSVAFGEGKCQMDWVWTHRATCLSVAEDFWGVIEIVPHPETLPEPAVQFASCAPGYPIEPFNVIAFLLVNEWCERPPPILPRLTGVVVESATEIRATFDQCVIPWAGGSLFVLRNKADPLDSILVAQATSIAENEYDLVLASPMIDGTTYILCQRYYVWSCSEGYNSWSQWEFTFVAAVATLLQSCSASVGGAGIEIAWELSKVDPGIEFIISRSGNGADFVPLDMTGLRRTGLQYSYIDARVEPGKRYIYKVEYAIAGESRLLFLSEAIETPAALLALHQNRPNPFNPSTTISFTLPVECAVRLEVYDVSGRLVARLIDGARQSAGAHDVEWNGRDAAGRGVASGIYVYRLVAGKEVISRKMVMLR